MIEGPLVDKIRYLYLPLIDYLNFDNSVRSTERKTFVLSKCSHWGVSQTPENSLKQHRTQKGNEKFS